MASPSGPQLNCSRRGDRQPEIRLTGVRRAPYSTRARGVKARLMPRLMPFSRAFALYPPRWRMRMPAAGTDSPEPAAEVATAVVVDGMLAAGTPADPAVPWWSFTKTVIAA